MRTIATKRKCAITGSIIIFEKEQFYNRMIFAFPSGEIDYYDKKHLFTLAGEDKIYEAGTTKKIIKFMGWKICLQVCYDLRFPVFARNVEDYDLLIYVANWPVTRIAAWDVLLKARAIENMSYVIGVNRIGIDKNIHKLLMNWVILLLNQQKRKVFLWRLWINENCLKTVKNSNS
jgi:predicted amidohydrolase